jgi:predicted extracellular nuclease/2',3'-cyclic-nucleotide 2'-phosphodiesterase (5'-nucleotidase family)
MGIEPPSRQETHLGRISMRSTRTFRNLSVVTVAALAASGLAFGPLGPPAAAEPADTFRLQLLHASDLEGGVEALGRAANFAAIIDKLEDDPSVDGSILLSAGDNYIPGPFFSASGDPSLRSPIQSVYQTLFPATSSASVTALREGPGRVDVTIMNVLGFDASAIGNHEWDLGSQTVRDLLGYSAAFPGVQFPYLSANLDFAVDVAVSPIVAPSVPVQLNTFAQTPPGSGSSGADKIAPSTLLEAGGETIGVIGATTQLLESISSPNGTTVVGPKSEDMPALATILQPQIDRLTKVADKVVLVSHLQQLALEQALVGLLRGVDIVVAGGSDTILANDPTALNPGDTAVASYPVVATTASSEPAVIVSTDGEYSYVGRLVVDFDADGILVDAMGDPIDEVADLDLTRNGPIAATASNVGQLWGPDDPFAFGTKGNLVDTLVDAVTAVVTVKDSSRFGETDVFLDGRRAKVRTEETNFGNLTADANLLVGRTFESSVAVSIKNGGGIRAEIGEVVNDPVTGTTTFLPPQANPLSGKQEGEVSRLDIENSLRFNNALSLVTVPASGLVRLVEHGVAAWSPTSTPGQFPQVGGIRFSFDPSQPANSRVRNLVVVDDAGLVRDTIVKDGVVQGDPGRPIRVVTLGFLAGGGDSYPFVEVTVPGSRRDLVVAGQRTGAATFVDDASEQDALAEYLADRHPLGTQSPYRQPETPPTADLRIQNLSLRSDGVVCAAADAPIGTVQGNGLSSPLVGSTVTVQGTVVGDYEYPGSGPTSSHLRGFYLQDAGDGDPLTSDGIFVFQSNDNEVALGDVVQVTGTVAEFQDQTQLNAGSAIEMCGSRGVVAPTPVSLPLASPDALEPFEGMLVRFPQQLSVTEHFQLGRFGQVVVSSGGRLPQPTSIAAPGASALAQQQANNLNRIIVDDDLQLQNPDPIKLARGGATLSASNTLRGGDTVTDLAGVLTYTWAGNSASGNAYRVRPIGALGGSASFAPANTRPATRPEVGGSVKVSAFNVLNYFVSLDFTSGNPNDNKCGPGKNVECRGADSAAELARQKTKLLAALNDLDADVLGLVELENTTGADPLGDATNGIVPGLNALGAGTYAAVGPTVVGSDAIKVGLVYRPAKVTPVGLTEVIDSTDDASFRDDLNRPVLVQTFEEKATGERFTVAVHHLKSKGSSCAGDPNLGDGQGDCNRTRTEAAQAVARVLARLVEEGKVDPDLLIIGDLNAYAKEDPVRAFEAAGYVNLIERFGGPSAYSYVFDGQWGYLDHALASDSLASQVVGAAEWHINADEPSVLDYNTEFKSLGQVGSLYAPDQFRTSDHDPVIVGLELNDPPEITVLGDLGVCAALNTAGATLTLEIDDADPVVTEVVTTGGLTAELSAAGRRRTLTVSAVVGSAPASGVVTVTARDSAGAVGRVEIVVVVGTTGDDVLVGDPTRASVLLGLQGDDTFTGLNGPDLLCGGNGDDVLSAGAGADTLDGANGADRLTGGPDGDRFVVSRGPDIRLDLTPAQGDRLSAT